MKTLGRDISHDAVQAASSLAGAMPEYKRSYLTTLSMLWNTKEFLHMAMATALFP